MSKPMNPGGDTLQTATKQEAALNSILSRVCRIQDRLSGSNDSMNNSFGRIFGPDPTGDEGKGVNSPCGVLGEINNTLNNIDDLVTVLESNADRLQSLG